jgi:prevent-host-death family protein
VAELRVGVRELKTQLSKCLRQVMAGQTVVITVRGKPVGRIMPAGQTLEQKLEEMRRAGLIEWSGKKLEPMQPESAML